MGEAKRRQNQQATSPDPDQELIFPSLPDLPITKGQAKAAYKWTSQGAWAGIIFLGVFWVVVRFVGPALGLWQVKG
ncbi:MAG: DUF2839 domain-containing protein [Cyanophyceae cyanobacterium]